MIQTRLPRAIYIIYRLMETLLSVASRFANAMFFGGSTYQSLSARAYIEGTTSPKWKARRDFIDALFFFQDDHCLNHWLSEVEAAQKTIDLAKIKI